MVRRVRADRERQSVAIDNRHDFHAFSALRSSDFQPAKGCVDEAFFFVQYASIAKLVGNIRRCFSNRRRLPSSASSSDSAISERWPVSSAYLNYTLASDLNRQFGDLPVG